MRPSLWFVVPAHGRAELSAICLRQLRRTCDELDQAGVDASAVVIANDANLVTAHRLGFATVPRDNTALGRKFNDGIQLALDPEHNPRPADYVVPCGSDDWIDPAILTRRLPSNGELRAFRQAAFVDETGRQIVSRLIDYPAGVGIRIYPRYVLGLTGFRPCEEDRKRACDTSILVRTVAAYRRERRQELRISYGDVHPWQIVDWKTRGEQLNTYREITRRFRGPAAADPFTALADTYPAEALDEMRQHYQLAGRPRVAVPA